MAMNHVHVDQISLNLLHAVLTDDEHKFDNNYGKTYDPWE